MNGSAGTSENFKKLCKNLWKSNLKTENPKIKLEKSKTNLKLFLNCVWISIFFNFLKIYFRFLKFVFDFSNSASLTLIEWKHEWGTHVQVVVFVMLLKCPSLPRSSSLVVIVFIKVTRNYNHKILNTFLHIEFFYPSSYRYEIT